MAFRSPYSPNLLFSITITDALAIEMMPLALFSFVALPNFFKIMFKNLTLFALCFGLFLTACNNAQPTSEASDNMGQFAEDKEFKEAHDAPAATTVTGKGKMISFATPDEFY